MNSREKRLVTILVVVAILIGVYYLGYKPLMNEQEELESQVTELEAEIAELNVDYVKMAEYQAGIEQANIDIESILKKYPAGLSQESAFQLLFDIEEAFEEKIDFMNVVFGNTVVLGFSDDNNDENTMHSMKSLVTSDLSLGYDDLKDLLTFISDYEDRTVLSDLTMSFVPEEDTISFNLNMNQYAIGGKDREYEVPEFDDVPVGKSYLFDSPGAIRQTPEEIERENRPSDDKADIFVRVKPTLSDLSAQIIGLVGDDDQSSYVIDDVNGPVTAVLRISQEGDQYYGNFDINRTYKTNQAFDVEEALEVVLYSGPRLGQDDLSEMSLTLINETDKTLYFTMLDEDEDNPRLTIVEQEGDIVIER